MTDPEPLPFSPAEIEASIPERFATVAAARPGALAISTDRQRLTYAGTIGRAPGLDALKRNAYLCRITESGCGAAR